MKIDNIESFPIAAASANQVMTFFVVRVSTDEGLVGWGESCDSFGISHPHSLAAIVDYSYKPLLLGREFLSPYPLISEIEAKTERSLGAYSGAAQARSALEIALSDIMGQSLGLSMSHLAGRVRDRIRIYAGSSPFLETGPASYHLDLLGPWLDRGVSMVKLRIGHDWRRALSVLEDVRSVLGEDIEIATDASEFFDSATALRISQGLSDINVAWLEEPVPHTRSSAVSEIADLSPVPIAYGEHIFGPDFGAEILRLSSLGVVQPDSSIAGGFGAARSLGMLAASAGARIAIHHHAGPISMAANLHLAGSLAAADVFEYPIHLSPLCAEVSPTSPFSLEDIVDGEITIPSGPGLGIELDVERLLSGRLI